MEIEKFIYKKVEKVSLLLWLEKEDSYPKLEKIVFNVEGGNYLVLKVEPNFDEIIVETTKQYEMVKKDPEHKIVSFEKEGEYIISRCIGKIIFWFWNLTNNQGYEDAVEIELHGIDTEDRISLRFLVVASDIKIGEIKNIEIK